ncbi:hypothetical protein PCASD_07913 [Puccinia coronata f. sp. avenae]|uniref:Uncharacterized protein n=1 Tax=Puccinia coronata f. sp. avenae TaxID=200324 RepID=A0A2N5UQ63_9BASI|nr:hypothetical protein PCASD_07913 [Puccinia coronata f. sp. avenae]
MPPCNCSNCAPAAAATLMDSLLVATKDNFDDIMANNFVGPKNVNLKHKYPPQANAIRKRKFTEDDKNEIEAFTTELSNDLHIYYDTEISPGGTLHGADLFDSDDCVAILAHLALIVNPRFLRLVIGAECFKGQHVWLFDWITSFKTRPTQYQPSQQAAHIHEDHTSKRPKRYGSLAHAQPTAPPSSSIQLGMLTKKAQASETSRKKSLERQKAKEDREAIAQKRRIQVAQIMAGTWAGPNNNS